MKLVLLAIILGLLACPWCEAQGEEQGCVIELNILYDFQRLEPMIATLDHKDVRNCTFAPNKYRLFIEHPGFYPIREEVVISEGQKVLRIERILCAKPVMVRLFIAYNLEPPQDLPECQAFFADAKEISRSVADGGYITPGRYQLEIKRSGYSFGPRKPIEILPSEQPYEIREKLVSKPRHISLAIIDVNAHQAMNLATGKNITFQDKFLPGEEIEILVTFHKYQTIKLHAKIVPGDGTFVIYCPTIKRLEKYEFCSRHHYLDMDNITYPYVLYADTEPIECHHIECEKGPGGRWMWCVWVAPEAKNLVVYAGYLFAKIGFDKVVVCGIPRLTEIHIPRLIEHLGYVARREERGDAAALDVLATLMNDPARHAKLKAAPAADIRRLLEYVQGWKLTEPQEQARCKTVIEALEGYLGKEGK